MPSRLSFLLVMRNFIARNKSIFLLPGIRKRIVRLRLFYFIKLKKRLHSISSENAFDVTVKHNLKGLYDCNDRMKSLIQPLVSIEKVNKDSKILVIGPRNENDLFLLYGNGLTWKNIIGLDLISYTPKIKLGDMHKIPFEDNSFDVVICGWTLGYSATPDIAAKEMLRVAKNGALIAIAQEYSTLTKEDIEILLGYAIQDYTKLEKRINSTGQILYLFSGHVDHVYFDHDAPNKLSHTRHGHEPNVSHASAIYSVKK
jgi:SAM-dependent methyltransferase